MLLALQWIWVQSFGWFRLLQGLFCWFIHLWGGLSRDYLVPRSIRRRLLDCRCILLGGPLPIEKKRCPLPIEKVGFVFSYNFKKNKKKSDFYFFLIWIHQQLNPSRQSRDMPPEEIRSLHMGIQFYLSSLSLKVVLPILNKDTSNYGSRWEFIRGHFRYGNSLFFSEQNQT